ncbi:hypothetical protein [Aestuariivita boseongensis]|uniref:hypothetical protein n=1 Tax=Aestuariivita boseongensis TaxID=1470562 RepID=UPI0006807442|nr:hypothetical protein [Aestuariivita boseongensis]
MAHDDQTFPKDSGVSAFGSLALQVVSVLSTRHLDQHANQARPHIRSILDRRLTTRAHFNAGDALEELRAFRLNDGMIIDKYIPDAARSMGDKWLENELGFAEVTIASVRLQSLLSEVEHVNPDTYHPCDRDLDVLMIACEDEQHTLGSCVAALQLRRRGAIVDRLCGEPDSVIKSRMQEGNYDAVLFSSSRSQDLEKIADLVNFAKTSLAHPPFLALGGILLETFGNIKRLTGVDLVTSDVDTVVTHCEQRSAQLLRQAQK